MRRLLTSGVVLTIIGYIVFWLAVVGFQVWLVTLIVRALLKYLGS